MDAAGEPGHHPGLVRTRTPNGSLAWAPPAAPGQQDPPPPTPASSSLNLKRARSPGSHGQLHGQAQGGDDVDADGEPDAHSHATPTVAVQVEQQHPARNDGGPAAAGPATPRQHGHDDDEPASKRPRRAAAQASARATRQLSKHQRGDSSSDEDDNGDDAKGDDDKDIAVDKPASPPPPPPPAPVAVKETKPKPERKKPGPKIHKLPKSVLLQQQQQQQQQQFPPPTLALVNAPDVTGADPVAGDLAVLDPVAGPSGTAPNAAPVPTAPLGPPPEPIIAHLVPVQPSDGQMPDRAAYDKAVDDYILSLHPIKRNKALMTDSLHDLVLKILIEPQNTQLGDPQLRFWVRQRFTLLDIPDGKFVLHENRKVVLKAALWDTIASAHAETKHGGRDKTYAAVKKGWSYVPKEVVTVFVKMCPTCGGKRATERKSTGPKKPKEPKTEALPAVPPGAAGQDIQAGPSAAQQLQQLAMAEGGNAVAGPSSSTALHSTESLDATAALVAALGAASNSHALNSMRASYDLSAQAGQGGEKDAPFGQQPQPDQQQQPLGPTSADFLPLPQQAHSGPPPPMSSLLGGGGVQSHQHPLHHPVPMYGYHPHAQHQHHQLPPQQSHPQTLTLPPGQYHPYAGPTNYPPLPPPPPPQF